MPKVTVIPATKDFYTGVDNNTFKKKKVAAYARVSTASEEQETSYDAQVDYYTKYIQGRPDWEFVKVYTDKAITGTNTKRRKGFKEMIDDALAGKIDLLEKDEIILIRGNHEDLMLDLVNRLDEFVEMGIEHTHHYRNRTVRTLMDLTECSLGRIKQQPGVIADRMRKTPFLQKIIPAMKDYFEIEHFIFVHGWIPCHASGYGGEADWFNYLENWREMPKSDWMLARWYNGMLAAFQGCIEPGKTIVCGHWHCSFGHTYLEKKEIKPLKDGELSPQKVFEDFTPYYGEGVIAIDACTALSKVVNCIVIEDEEKRA